MHHDDDADVDLVLMAVVVTGGAGDMMIAGVQSEDMNDEVRAEIQDELIVSRHEPETRSSVTDTSRHLYGSSLYSETSSLMSQNVVRAPIHCGSVSQSNHHSVQSLSP